MSLESKIANEFMIHDWEWRFKGNIWRVPTEGDVRDALDETARLLYDEPVDAQLEVGRLIIRKTTNGHDVYMLAGSYQ